MEVEGGEGVGEGVFDEEALVVEVVEFFALALGEDDEVFFDEGFEAAVGVAEVFADVFGDLRDGVWGDVEEGADDVFLVGGDLDADGVVFDAAFFEVGVKGADFLGGEGFEGGGEGGVAGGEVVRVFEVGFEDGGEDGEEGVGEAVGMKVEGFGAEEGEEEAEDFGRGVGGHGVWFLFWGW